MEEQLPDGLGPNCRASIRARRGWGLADPVRFRPTDWFAAPRRVPRMLARQPPPRRSGDASWARSSVAVRSGWLVYPIPRWLKAEVQSSLHRTRSGNTSVGPHAVTRPALDNIQSRVSDRPSGLRLLSLPRASGSCHPTGVAAPCQAPKELRGWRSYRPAAGQVLPGSAGLRCSPSGAGLYHDDRPSCRVSWRARDGALAALLS